MKTIQKMVEHSNWGNKLLLEAVQHAGNKNVKLERLFGHMLNAERVWLARLKGEDTSTLPIWSEVDLTVCAKMMKQNEEDFRIYLDELAVSELDNIIEYRNSMGIEFKNSRREILTQIVLHGQYHRGQINALLRADGHEPINVDFITFVR